MRFKNLILGAFFLSIAFAQEKTESIKPEETKFTFGNYTFLLGVNQDAAFGQTYTTSLGYIQNLPYDSFWLETLFTAGFFREDLRENVQRARWYENDLFFSGDLLFSYALAGYNPKLESSLRPWAGLGFTAVYTGGKYQMGAVLGLGAMSWMAKEKTFGWRLGVLDRIYYPDLTGDPNLTHNFSLYGGVQFNL